jgi:asparagine synthase (glutamine-hydrolysing)
MCGIAGIVSPDPSFVEKHRLQQMANALKHRGPDGEGYWIDEQHHFGFAHRRLSIIDLSENAAQPFRYLHYVIIFNGAIYNYIEIKAELEKKGYKFSTASDTEVIPAAYDCWGIDCLDKFDGMFAFALWNNFTEQMILARDRFGEKPLYYYAEYIERGSFRQFVFASEMKAIWSIGIPKNLNGTMMLNYLTHGHLQNPLKETETFYTNILSLPQGHYLTIVPKQGKVQLRKWYQPVLKTKESLEMTESEVIEKFSELFLQGVTRRLRSDVNTGTSLSGGIDSSSIVSAVHQLKSCPPNGPTSRSQLHFPAL